MSRRHAGRRPYRLFAYLASPPVRRLLQWLGVVLVGVQLSGCVLIASSVVCDRPRGKTDWLLQASLVSSGVPRADGRGSDFAASAHLVVWDDGYLSYFNGQYEWCQQLAEPQVGEVRASLETLRSVERGGFPEELASRGDTVVAVSFDRTGEARPPFRELAAWSPEAPASELLARPLDQLFCALESTLGSGYRQQMSRSFSDFLEARGRTEACPRSSSRSQSQTR